VARVRLDNLLVERGVYETRSRAAASVMAGEVMLGCGRHRATKPGQLVPEDVVLAVEEAAQYVSRGGVKLANALAVLGVDVQARRCLDVGASTGGFTDCLLQRGALEVIALDVAYGELSWQLREDPRVTVLERTNARSLEPAQLPYAPDLITADVSFISLEKILPAVLACAAPSFDALVLVKPQFEAGREHVGKGGVVRDADARREALVAVARAAVGLGAGFHGFASSGLPGPKGNLETFAWLTEGSRPGSADIEAEAARAEP
jgi:23S rRNA (cytidine1920-2'-O)/16S rRNA (cytidine1409-2'-O)-methyltransferase